MIINHLVWQGRAGYENQIWFAALVIVACLTDLLDGPLARTLNQESKFGSLLDKIVDKLLILPLGVVEFWPVDKWLVTLSIIGMLVVVLVAVYKYYQPNQPVPENVFGKVGMVCYSLGIILAIWPVCLPAATKIGWAGFYFSLASGLLNFRRHFDFPGPYKH